MTHHKFFGLRIGRDAISRYNHSRHNLGAQAVSSLPLLATNPHRLRRWRRRCEYDIPPRHLGPPHTSNSPARRSLNPDSPGLAGFSLPNLPMHSLGQLCYICHPKTGRFRVYKCTRADSISPDRRGTPLPPGLRARSGFPTPVSDFRLARLQSSNIAVPGPDINFCTFSSPPFELLALRPRVPLLGTPPRRSDRHRAGGEAAGRAAAPAAAQPGPGSTYRPIGDYGRASLPLTPGTFFVIFALTNFVTLPPTLFSLFFYSYFFFRFDHQLPADLSARFRLTVCLLPGSFFCLLVRNFFAAHSEPRARSL